MTAKRGCVIITGANSGIGFETTLALAQHNYRVIMACRDLKKAEGALQQMKETSHGIEVDIHVEKLDLCSFASIRAFANNIVTNEEKVSLLINNAGAIGTRRVLTRDGLCSIWQSNYFGHFLLTLLLLDKLKQSAPARIINVTSNAYLYGKIEFDNLNSEKWFSQFGTYSNTKLANMLFTRELARQLEGTNISVFSVHPGLVDTNVTKNGGQLWQMLGKFASIFHISKNAADGAKTSIYCATEIGLEIHTGCYFADCCLKNDSGKAHDMDIADRLWKISLTLTGLTENSEEKIEPDH